MPASRAVRVKRRPIPPHPPATATRVPGGGIKANPDIYPPTIVIEETLPSSREVSSVYRRKMIASPTFPGNNHARKEARFPHRQVALMNLRRDTRATRRRQIAAYPAHRVGILRGADQ